MTTEERLQKLEYEVRLLRTSQINQQDIPPDVIKQRHIGEGVRFIRGGLAASRPTTGENSANGLAVYFSTDTSTLSVWDGTQWVDFV